MSYQVYTTEALVCGSFDNNTADKSFLLFTRDAGMLYASARSVREERSRQRYALQDFSLITVSLIRGKTGWRIGSVDSDHNFFRIALTREARGSVVRTLKLVRRYVQGEEPHSKLYTELITALQYLAASTVPQRLLAEEVIAARFFYELGYISDSAQLAAVFTGSLEQALATTPESSLSALQIITARAATVSQL